MIHCTDAHGEVPHTLDKQLENLRFMLEERRIRTLRDRQIQKRIDAADELNRSGHGLAADQSDIDPVLLHDHEWRSKSDGQ